MFHMLTSAALFAGLWMFSRNSTRWLCSGALPAGEPSSRRRTELESPRQSYKRLVIRRDLGEKYVLIIVGSCTPAILHGSREAVGRFPSRPCAQQPTLANAVPEALCSRHGALRASTLAYAALANVRTGCNLLQLELKPKPRGTYSQRGG